MVRGDIGCVELMEHQVEQGLDMFERGKWIGAAVITAALLVLGCASDEVDEVGSLDPGEEACEAEEGMVYNPISGDCVDESVLENDDDDSDGGGGDGNDGNGGANGGDDENGGGGGGEGEPPLDECGYGGLHGQSCGTGGAPLPGADVTVVGEDCEGNEVEESTVAGANGYFEFEDLPAGQYTLTMESGSFTGEDSVIILADQVTDLASGGKKVCLSPTSVEIAVLDGSFDDVGSILDDMDLDYNVYSSGDGLLFNPGDMAAYDIIFAECSWWTEYKDFGSSLDADVGSNILSCVENGGSFYASDQSQPFIQFGIPEAMTFYNESGGVDGPRVGSPVNGVPASVESDEMQTVLNSTTTSIDFAGSGGWAVVEEATNPNSTVHFRADAPNSSGTDISDAALMVHYEVDGGGSAIYTSFHNSAQSTGDMIDILEYMIFQL